MCMTLHILQRKARTDQLGAQNLKTNNPTVARLKSLSGISIQQEAVSPILLSGLQ